MMAPWHYFGNKTEPLGHTLIEGYGHNLQAAWEQFEYWWLTLMGEKFEPISAKPSQSLLSALRK
jgi:hypothetical protein